MSERIDIGKLLPQYEPLRPVFEALAEQFGILPADLTNLSATGWSSEPFIRAELTVLLQRPERIKPERLRERASMLLATANRLEGTSDTAPDAARSEVGDVPPLDPATEKKIDTAYQLGKMDAKQERDLVLQDRERELLEIKGPCSSSACRLHYAHSGLCDMRSVEQ